LNELKLREDQIIKLISTTIRDKSALEIIPKIGLKSVFSVSKIFPDINLSKESLWIVGFLEQPYSFALTNKYFMLINNGQTVTLSIKDIKTIGDTLNQSALNSNLKEDILRLIEKLNTDELQPIANEPTVLKDNSFDDFLNKMKELGQIIEDKAAQVVEKRHKESKANHSDNPREEKIVQPEIAKDFILDSTFLDFLQEEGNKLYEVLEGLKSDKSFMSALHSSLANSEFLSNEFSVEHVMLQDIIWLYNLCDGEKTAIKEIKAKYSLAYLFEKLQGKDMIELLSIERINEMVQKEKFNESIATLKQANFLKLPAEYENQLMLPSLLSRLKHPFFEKLAAHYIRYANILLKADGEISPEEEAILKKINRICNQPKVVVVGVKQSEVPENETLEDVLKELRQLIGLNNIKADVDSLINFLKIQKAREEQSLATTERTLHAVFMGPPGTGKTTVARLIGRIYKHLGYLDSGHLVETDRAGLVAGYVGQTAIRVDEVVTSAIDGVLFIDEAYALVKEDNNRDFGSEAVETLLKRMEDHRNDLAVIVAGYSEEMKTFIESNPGLKSRFNRYFKFNHYDGKEMLAIYKLYAEKADFKLDEEAEEKLSFILDGMYERKDNRFGNARVVRNLFEECVANQANRLVSVKELTKEVLVTLTEPDIPPIKETIDKYLEFGEVK
jgi:SpoVK/Ycf46/Vps4 family AAA+-type ATPase